MPQQRPRNRLAKVALGLIILGLTSSSFYLKIVSYISLTSSDVNVVSMHYLDRPILNHHINNFTNENETRRHEEDTAQNNNIGVKLDPFAQQKPKGEKFKWTSRYNNHAEYHSWWRNSDSCFEVDNICRSSKDQWFYYHVDSHTNNTAAAAAAFEEEPHQPTLELMYPPLHYRKAVWADTRIRMTVQSTSRTDLQAIDDACHISSIPNHVVVQSTFNVSEINCPVLVHFKMYLLS